MYGSNTDDHKTKNNTTEKCKLRVCVDGCEMLISLKLGISKYGLPPWVEK